MPTESGGSSLPENLTRPNSENKRVIEKPKTPETPEQLRDLNETLNAQVRDLASQSEERFSQAVQEAVKQDPDLESEIVSMSKAFNNLDAEQDNVFSNVDADTAVLIESISSSQEKQAPDVWVDSDNLTTLDAPIVTQREAEKTKQPELPTPEPDKLESADESLKAGGGDLAKTGQETIISRSDQEEKENAQKEVRESLVDIWEQSTKFVESEREKVFDQESIRELANVMQEKLVELRAGNVGIVQNEIFNNQKPDQAKLRRALDLLSPEDRYAVLDDLNVEKVRPGAELPPEKSIEANLERQKEHANHLQKLAYGEGGLVYDDIENRHTVIWDKLYKLLNEVATTEEDLPDWLTENKAHPLYKKIRKLSEQHNDSSVAKHRTAKVEINAQYYERTKSEFLEDKETVDNRVQELNNVCLNALLVAGRQIKVEILMSSTNPEKQSFFEGLLREVVDRIEIMQAMMEAQTNGYDSLDEGKFTTRIAHLEGLALPAVTKPERGVPNSERGFQGTAYIGEIIGPVLSLLSGLKTSAPAVLKNGPEGLSSYSLYLPHKRSRGLTKEEFIDQFSKDARLEAGVEKYNLDDSDGYTGNMGQSPDDSVCTYDFGLTFPIFKGIEANGLRSAALESFDGDVIANDNIRYGADFLASSLSVQRAVEDIFLIAYGEKDGRKFSDEYLNRVSNIATPGFKLPKVEVPSFATTSS